MKKPQILKKTVHPAFAPPRGQGVVEYILIATLITLVAVGGLALSGESLSNVYQNMVSSLQGNEQGSEGTQEQPPSLLPTPTSIPEDITIQVVNSSGAGISDITVLAFDSTGTQQAYTSTDDNGLATFSGFTPGRYKFRADYGGQGFWSDTISYPSQTLVTITISGREIYVHVMNARGQILPNVNVHAYTGEGEYTGFSISTNQNGTSIFQLPDGSYKFRADYKGQSYWSDTIQTTQTTSVHIRIPEAPFTVRVYNRKGQAVPDVPVYAFTQNGDYTGISGRTDADGAATLELPDGTYRFRVDYQGEAYWSDVVTTPGMDATTVQVGGTPITVRVTNNAGAGLSNMRVDAFDANGEYTGKSAVTNASGNATLELNDGTYKFRTDHQNVSY